MESISCGIIGAGFISRRIHLPILKSIPYLNVTYVADISNKNLDKYNKSIECESILIEESPKNKLTVSDIALVAIPVGARIPYIKELKKNKVCLFCEKPFAINKKMHKQIESCVPYAYCNYMRVHMNQTKITKSIVKHKPFGKLNRVEWTEGGIQKSEGKGRNHYQNVIDLAGGGLLLQNGCHSISQIMEIIDIKQINVKESCVKYVEKFDVDIKSSFEVIGDDGKIPIDFEVTRVRDVEEIAKFEFEEAVVTFKPGNPNSDIRFYKPKKKDFSFSINKKSKYAGSLIQAHYLRWQEFIESMKNDKNTVQSGVSTGFDVTALIQDIYNK